MLGHDDKCVQLVPALPAIAVESLKEEAHVVLNHEQFSAMMGGESYEVRSGRGEESSWLQERTSAAKAARLLPNLNRHEWNSCPSRLFFVVSVFLLGKFEAGGCVADSASVEEVNSRRQDFLATGGFLG